MGDKTKIEWTDATWGPVTGCTKVSAGCDNCYAETLAERFRGMDTAEADYVRAAVDRDLLDGDDVWSNDLAHQALTDFHVVTPATERTVQFQDTWEWDLRGFDHHFLIACHAIRWGVEQYLAAGGQIARTETG